MFDEENVKLLSTDDLKSWMLTGSELYGYLKIDNKSIVKFEKGGGQNLYNIRFYLTIIHSIVNEADYIEWFVKKWLPFDVTINEFTGNGLNYQPSDVKGGINDYFHFEKQSLAWYFLRKNQLPLDLEKRIIYNLFQDQLVNNQEINMRKIFWAYIYF